MYAIAGHILPEAEMFSYPSCSKIIQVKHHNELKSIKHCHNKTDLGLFYTQLESEEQISNT